MNINDIAATLALLGYTVNLDDTFITIEPEIGEWMPIVTTEGGTIYLEATTAHDGVMTDIRPRDGRPINDIDDLTAALEYFGETTLTTL